MRSGGCSRSRKKPLADEGVICLPVKRALDSIEELSTRQAHLLGHLADVIARQFALTVRDKSAGYQLAIQVEAVNAVV